MVPPLRIRFPYSQSASPFFGKLNADVRCLIYKELFGISRVYIMFTSPANFHRYPGPVVWRHRIREDSRKTQSSSRLQGTNLIFTCKKAYYESVAVLYGSNTMIFESPEQYILFNDTFEHNVTKFNSADVHLWGVDNESIYFEYAYNRSAKKQAKKQIIQALKRLLSVRGLRGRVFLPAQLEDAAREMAQNHTGKVSLTFHVEETVYEDRRLTRNEFGSGGYRIFDRRDLMGIGEFDDVFAGDNKDHDADKPQALFDQRY
ncbi:hypothetical protein NW762_001376 [Fusarium torreyae]|uniref:DUF7730 domain-containing protein n=1 Tax=Fusarium torreyae TaxID=1237075 RepID=A0A9W8SEF3_9HYPO|nr:hypothetical protein NW762_001376 [Fusarium torreyae]